MGTTGYTVWKLRQQFGAEADMGDMQLLYFGLKDTPKFKLAQRVTHSFDRDDDFDASTSGNEAWRGTISVTESVGGKFFEYEMSHPSHPAMGDLSYCRNDNELYNKILEDKTGLMAAMHVLQNSYEEQKTDCKVSYADAGDSEAGSSDVVLDDQMPFDCSKQLFRWRVDGWILESNLDGDIKGLYAGDGGQYFEVVDQVLDLAKVPFSGCSESSSSQITCTSDDGVETVLGGNGRGLSSTDPYVDSLAQMLASDWATVASQTQWCVAGWMGLKVAERTAPADESFSCPGKVQYGNDTVKTADSLSDAALSELEFACHRYVHGRRMTEISPIYQYLYKTTCDNDYIMTKSTKSDSFVQKLISYAGFWGCYDTGEHKCLKPRMRNGRMTMEYGTCTGEFTRSGPTRFDNIQKKYGWSSASPWSPRNQCNRRGDTLSWTPGCWSGEPGHCI